MTSIQSPFTQFFIEALRQQYMVACRTQSHKGLKDILLKLGFSEEDTDKLFIVATMTSEDITSENILNVASAISKMKEHDISCSCPRCADKK